jgi:phage terminase small subunit
MNLATKSGHSKKLIGLTSPLQMLTDQQKMFIDAVMKGASPVMAARMAGYAQPESQAHSVLKSPKMQEAIRYLHKKNEKVADVTRKKVMDGFLEAIDMAKLQADATAMISGWREIGRMCGYYAPEVKKVDINITSKRIIDKLETMSDEDLLRMVEESQSIIEGEVIEVLSDES